ncbi:E3 ubiquitin-protein ligase DIS1-like isoform X3 [Phoenix dactylifera]|uniref:E3 ubiquitin-protein ligase DIS1-like isoform X3 n=1 Tax=Phoenix dactylifera TaxID=42345 RepID=A0A8B7BWM6_PHODC|nr:E3 ubiquitin-protein ligase DIS1-like isoform X3 [Phoenix dactylifera]
MSSSDPESSDPQNIEDMMDINEDADDYAQHLSKPSVSVASSVYELLECPVCLNAMYPPIHQCSNGHTLCSGCKSRVFNKCPTCRHELGDIPHLVSHLKDDHKVDMHNGSSFNHRYVRSNPDEVENATWMLTVFSCFGQYFCLHFEAFQMAMAPVYTAFLRFMGDESEAKNYSYSLEVGGNGRKIIWQGVPRSIRDSHKKVRDSYDGLVVHRNMALFFSGGGDSRELKLKVTGKIWKEQ